MMYCDCRYRDATRCLAARFGLTNPERAELEATNDGCACPRCHQPADVDVGAVVG